MVPFASSSSIRTALLAVICAGVVAGAAQEMRFKRLTVDDGLSNNNVLALIQDRHGYVWIGTNDGLNKYDGYGFTTFRHDARVATSLSNNSVSALLLDQSGNLWVGTSGGLNLYNASNGTFSLFDIRDGTRESSGSSSRITALFQDRSSRLWVGSTRGLFLFDPERGTFRRYDYEPTSNSDFRDDRYQHNYVTSVFEDSRDRLWIGTASGLNLLDPARGTYSRYEMVAGEAISDEVRDMAEDAGGRIWVATVRDGLYHVDPANRAYRHFEHRVGDESSLPANSVRAVHPSRDGLIVGTSEGVAVFDGETFTTFTTAYGDESSLSFPSVRCIMEDVWGNLWIGTWEGLNYFDRFSNHFAHVRRNPENPRGLSDDLVSSFAEDEDGGVWVGTERGGLNYLDPEDRSVRVFRHDPANPSSLSVDNVKTLLIDSRGDLWVGTHDGGLNRRTGESFIKYQHDPLDSTSLSGDRVYALFEDRFGDLWIGTNKSGLNRFDRDTGRFARFDVDSGPHSISSNEVNAILEDAVGSLWIGTAHGLNLFDRRTGRFVNYLPQKDDPRSLIDPTVKALYEDRRGNLWMGTSGGLELFDRQKGVFTHFTVREGLPNETINCILEDAAENLWISTNQGLARFDPHDKTFRNFDRTDGLQSSQFNMNACLSAGNLRLYFGGVNGFSRFHPADISANPHAPPVYITGFKLFNQSVGVGAPGSLLERDISETKEITLRHNQNAISLDFVALNFTAQSRNRYAYKLEGFEDDWNEVGAQRTATYTNLPPGEYTFRVKAANNDGVWNEQGAALGLRVLPPVWRTWWAYLLYMLAFAAALYGAYRYSAKLLRLKNSLAVEQVRRRSEDDLHAVKMQFFTNVSHEFRTPLTLILGPLQEMLKDHGTQNREHLLLIRRNAERLLRLVNQLMDFRKLETDHMRLEVSRENVVAFIHELALSFDDFARQARVRFRVRSDYEGLYAWFDHEKLETVFINLLSNAFKFTPDGGEVTVEIRVSGPAPQEVASTATAESGMVHIAVHDTGIGISEAELENLFHRFYQAHPRHGKAHGTGIGLALSKGIVELHGGTLTVESREGEGSTFTVTMPLGKSHLDHAATAPEHAMVRRAIPSFEIEGDGPAHEEFAGENEDAPLVLIIEDNRDMRAFVRSGLSGHHRVVEAADGAEGFRIAVETFPDLIVCDVAMPEMDGMTLCRKLKEDLRTSHIPIILLTARTSTADQMEGLDTGADAYITKPFDLALLGARVRNLITIRRKLRERFSLDLPVKPLDGGRSTRDDAFLRKVIDIVEERLSDSNLSVESLSSDVGMSRVYLHKKLTALTNHTPSDLIRTIRLKHAARLLLEGDLTVSEVAYDVGFSSPSHFATAFKKQYGQTPTEYAAGFVDRREDISEE